MARKLCKSLKQKLCYLCCVKVICEYEIRHIAIHFSDFVPGHAGDIGGLCRRYALLQRRIEVFQLYG